MQYTKFIITNFKGIKGKLELNLSTLPNTNIFTFVGLNESGKTSVLEAINLLQNSLPDEESHKMIHKSKKGNFNSDISIKAFLKLDEEDENRISEFCEKEIGFKITQKIEKVEIEKKYIFKASKYDSFESLWVLPLKGKLRKGRNEIDLYQKDKLSWTKVVKYIEDNFPKILYYENFLFDFPQKIFLEISESETKEEKEYRKILQDILDSFNNGLTIEKHLLARLEDESSEQQESLEALLGDIAQRLTETIFTSWNEVFLKSAKEIELKTAKDEQKGYYIQLKIKQGKDRFSIDERSLGFRWFFSFLLFTEFRKERKEDFGETLFLLDEPASNLHQKSQQKLLGIFEKLSQKCKIIYSTHSHHLINPKYLAGTYIVKNKAINYNEEENFDQNETDISATLYKNFVSTYPKETDHFKPVLDAIDYIPSVFELTENIVCLEGKNDYYTLRYFQEVVFVEKDFSFLFYPGASVSKYEDLFRLYTAWNKKFIAIFDSDKQGKKEQKRYIQEISVELRNNIFILEDIDSIWENYTTESLFSESEKISIIQTIFPKETRYNKSKFNAALQDIFISKKETALSEETKTNFSKIFQFIQEKFSQLEN